MFLLFAFIGLVFIGAALPLMLRRVPPNAMYGLRVGETLENEAVWYEANARSAGDLLWIGIGTVILSALLFLLPWNNPDHYALVCCAGLIGSVLWYCVRGIRIARDVKRELEESGKI